ncbi:succinate dehydrogenase, cytochrome b556 subunit [Aliiroseovarius subalbicans]|uniref:succinate dehydrogenase, cytochrome b556 subunit n=1 Tax=Aliiroseovarius subalbicans TaxID=2925840 RepID=UPI001F5842A9|nr:succinate dehydrogenase, cytochrome b556 subunit [Aliiroseovarius subalbicans]MCI2400654.1 succinate dehydrogenase, cytochrome b556 subunit [Aliiroseovarius subalbicans]
MANVNQGNRPLSPHLQVYRMPLNAVMSITHRATGVGMAVSAMLITWWFLSAATSEEYFATANGFMTSWLGDIIMFFSMLGIWYHFCSGIRHLVWDTGSGLGQRRVKRSGIAALICAAALSLITIIIA